MNEYKKFDYYFMGHDKSRTTTLVWIWIKIHLYVFWLFTWCP